MLAIAKVPLYSVCVAPDMVMLSPLAKLAGAAVGSVVVVTVAVVPLRVMEAMDSTVPGSAFMVVLVVAGVTGPVAMVYVNVVVLGTVTTVIVPLYSVVFEPEIVTWSFTAKPWLFWVVTSADVPVRAMLLIFFPLELPTFVAFALPASEAGVVGVSGSVNVNVVAPVTVTVCEPLYSVWFAFRIVIT
jgi:hypothetical protein